MPPTPCALRELGCDPPEITRPISCADEKPAIRLLEHMSKFKGPRGAPDVVPPASAVRERVVRLAEDLFKRYGYRRIETPVFEDAEVLERGLDAQSDMVVKETYTFKDRGGRLLTLRPDGTTPVIRAVLEHALDRAGLPVKLYYSSPMFRYERPQKARHRQHFQVGVEAIGSEDPALDAEVIQLAAALYSSLGLEGVRLKLNSIGHPGCRSDYLPKLVEYLRVYSEELDEDCRRRIETNPLRTFDCKVARDIEILLAAPVITDFLCDDCREHFDKLQGLLGVAGLTFELDPRLVRGLDYYTRTVFEFISMSLGAQNAVGSGGRYDGLAELLGGERLPGIGFGIGVERLMEVMERQGITFSEDPLDVFVIAIGDVAKEDAIRLAEMIRLAGFSADLDYSGQAVRSVRGQFKAADRAGARSAAVLGDRELKVGKVTFRDMASGEETLISKEDLLERLRHSR